MEQTQELNMEKLNNIVKEEEMLGSVNRYQKHGKDRIYVNKRNGKLAAMLEQGETYPTPRNEWDENAIMIELEKQGYITFR